MGNLLYRSGMTLWLRADRGITVADGAKVPSWGNMKGGGPTGPTEGTDANRPTYRASFAFLNNKPVVEFASANSQRLSLANGALAIPNDSRNHYIFAVVRTGSAFGGADWSIYAQRGSVDADPILAQFGGRGTTTLTCDYRDDAAGGLLRVGSQTLSTSTVYLLGARMLDGTASTMVNGVWGAGTAYTGGAITTDRAAIGFSPGAAGTGYFNGHLAELLIFNRDILNKERQVCRYLTRKYNLTGVTL